MKNATLKQEGNQIIIKDKKRTLTLNYIKINGEKFVELYINETLAGTFPVEKKGSDIIWHIENLTDRVTYELYVSRSLFAMSAWRNEDFIWAFEKPTNIRKLYKIRHS